MANPADRPQHDEQIVKSAIRARQGEKGPSMVAVLTISTLLAIMVLGLVWFVFAAGA